MTKRIDAITSYDATYEFIELHRTFHELSEHDFENEEIETRLRFHIGERLRWSHLIKEYRLIILSEAGSGKTEEMRNVARTLREQAKPAFFLRLEHISEDFEDAFEIGTYETFDEWLASGKEGWLLLDSVDEARLRDPRDFELAICKLGKRISTAKGRTHIVISGRTTAWRPKTDLAYCTAHLPYAVVVTSEFDPQSEEENSVATSQTKSDPQDRAKPVFKVVALDDLTSDQIAVFAKARGIEDNKAFLDAVERADAWSFTARPQDLDELTEFWIDKRRIGTRLEIMRNSIDRRLAERDQNRADVRQLSVEKARQGAKLLAAATTLSQEPLIRVPDGTANSKGIAVQFVLSDWNDSDQSTLLLRPIFDEAIYGAVRFHHRSVREYLAAEWFAELLERETSRRTIERLFFRHQYGLVIVVPALRPILPWLAIRDEKMRERVLKFAPEIFFEGGDPSQLPFVVRRRILLEICEQMAKGEAGRSIRDYPAVQRFADPDLTEDVRALLRKYAASDDLKAFLLRMIWIGQLSGARPEAMEVALMPTAEHYARAVAFRAIRAIGTCEEKALVRQKFLEEASELDRELLAELLEDIRPTEQTLGWLLECLEKSSPKEPYTDDDLSDGVTEFVGTASIELLPLLVIGLDRLLSLSPMIETRHCRVSEKFQWLITPASKAVERLVLGSHPASLEKNALSILNKLKSVRLYSGGEQSKINIEFSLLVPTWKELNRALFWFEVHISREVIGMKRGERVTNYRQASITGSFWRFEEDDFEYFAYQISHQPLLDDRFVALSLAFDLYKSAKRPRAWRLKLKKLVTCNDELSKRLETYFRPAKQSRNSRQWKNLNTRWKMRDEANREKEKQYHADWKKYLNEKLGDERATLRNKPGTITNSLIYLLGQSRKNNNIERRWTDNNWETLIPQHGEDVAHYYRDGTVSFWRHYTPSLRSEGAPFNKTPYEVIIGLTGIEIEANETIGWPNNLNILEVERACRYASFELNGFPTWFPKLFETHPKPVSDFLMQEVKYELSIEDPNIESHYILSDLSWSGQWAWDDISPIIYQLLMKSEPNNLANLDKLLKIVQGSALQDELIENLAFNKCSDLEKPDHVARWFAVWTGVSPDIAIAFLKDRIEMINDRTERTSFAMTFVTYLIGDRRSNMTGARQGFKKPGYLKSLYLLMHEFIPRNEDINRAGSGVYSPEMRDYAQKARNALVDLLVQIPGKESFLALMEIAKMSPEEVSRPWIWQLAKLRAEQDGDIEPWSLPQVREFHDRLERTPSNHQELAELAILRCLDLKDDLEHGDSSIASILRTVTQETDMRKYMGRELREKAFGRYSIPPEEELADAKKPDLRLHGVGFDGPVPIELKLADNWSGPNLFERLENQLCGDYLRDNRSSRGIFVLVYRGEKTGWDVPRRDDRMNFSVLTCALQEHWQRISVNYPKVDDITVIGIDLTKRSS